MYDFEFYNPTRLLFGRSSLEQLDTLVPNDARVLLLYGGQSAKRNGTLAQVSQVLGKRICAEFGGISPNPDYHQLLQAVEQIRQQKLDFILAIGGGSIIDAGKFIAAAVPYQGEPWEILETDGRHIDQALPLGTVLTLPATGSEMNNCAVISNSALGLKRSFRHPSVFPRFSVLAPQLSFSLPQPQIANGVVDAFVHVTEQYLTYPVDAKVQDRFAEGLLLTLIEEGPKALAEPENYRVRANIMFSATMALNGLIGTGVPQDWSTHKLGHELTVRHGLDHAVTLAILLPAMLRLRKAAKHAKLLQYAERVWQLSDGSEEQRIDAAIELTRQFFESMGLQTHLSDYGIGHEAIAPLLENLERQGLTQLGEDGRVDLELSRQVFQASL
ncbi:iron-containing alcohol dehydrogenase [Shewanella algae]|uniref:iron-containing alcohol dehydrogenase n=1 Tax=Shewanella algae TaxID=38313 RepID=UPI001F3C4BEF|nr:iron-containing alcohol dehydrogenase [Shewanella algae]MCE9776285.1 iron-containing alcohol dehydrogenase [Shewanella algae]